MGLKHTVLWVEEKSKKKRLFSLLSDPSYFKYATDVLVLNFERYISDSSGK